MLVDTWLVVVDLQEVFADPRSEWHAPGTADLVKPVARLAAAVNDRFVLTRFVAPEVPDGAWRDYYERWPFALRAEDASIYRLIAGLPSGPVVDSTTFSKWVPALWEITGSSDLIVCGVATDCCVLSTVVAAADAGRKVRVAADACRGSDPEAHERALGVLAGYQPIVEVTTVDDELRRIGSA